MDPKERWLLEGMRAKLDSGSFTERDILSLLILLRRHASSEPVVKEFGDFIAHRDKDKGILKDYLSRVQKLLKGSKEEALSLPIFTEKEIHLSFNKVLSKIGLTEINSELANQITVCIITLLQSVKVETKLENQIIGFSVAMSSHQIALCGHGTLVAGHRITFPLITAINNGYEESLKFVPFKDLLTCSHIVESYCIGGKFKVEQRPWKL
jgi:hypothetical protein